MTKSGQYEAAFNAMQSFIKAGVPLSELADTVAGHFRALVEEILQTLDDEALGLARE